MIRYLVMDVDGTLTDGKIYMGPDGEAMKAFSVKDGYVFNYIIKPVGITPIVITARKSTIVEKRCDELGISNVFQGRTDKMAALREIIGSDGLSQCAYFGDDILDVKCMLPIKEAGGIVGCPSDAVKAVQAISDYVCKSKAGEGALREFAEWLVSFHHLNDGMQERIEAAKKYLLSLNVSEENVGKKVIVDDNFYYIMHSYLPGKKSECMLESHRQYVDVQLILKGKEIMHIADTLRLSLKEDYNENADVMLWNMPKHTLDIDFKAGQVLVLYPDNAHGVSKTDDFDEPVFKLVGKVKVV